MIHLTRPLVIRLYCALREAERSLDKVLGGSWSGLQAYYGPEKMLAVERLVDTLGELLSAEGDSFLPATRAAIEGGIPAPGLGQVIFRKWINRWRRLWTFREVEIAFAASRLTNLISFLKAPAKPDAETLIALRIDFLTCEYVIESRCQGLLELARAVHVQHFGQPEWSPAVRSEQLIGSERGGRRERHSSRQKYSA